MDETIQIRRLAATDHGHAAQAIRCIKERAISRRRSSRESLDMSAWLAKSCNILLVASEDDIPVGFALAYLLDRVDGNDQMLFFYEIEVVADRRRRGIGTALVEAMKQLARQHQVAKMWVQTEPDNAAARALYRRAGGVEKTQPDLIISWIHARKRSDEPNCL